MALLLGTFLKNNRIVWSSSLKRTFQISKPHLPRQHSLVCHRLTATRTNVRSVCFSSAVRRTPPARVFHSSAPLSRCGHFHSSAPRCGHFHSSAPLSRCGHFHSSAPLSRCGHFHSSAPLSRCGHFHSSAPLSRCGHFHSSAPRCGHFHSSAPLSRCGHFHSSAPLSRCGHFHSSAPLSRCGHFHSSAPHRALPAPLVWMVLKPLQKLLTIILGRSLRKWWVALPGNRRQLLREWMWCQRWRLAAGAGLSLVIIAILLFTHLDESPLTGRTRLLVFSKENYMELAAFLSQEYMEEFADGMLPASDPHHQVVERVIQHIAQRNKDIREVSEVDWTVHVVQDPKVNAFVLPNGKVFVFTGMLDVVSDVHQLTIVLGHEMAHALLGHSAEQASLSHVVDLLSMILLTAIWAICPRDSLALLGHWAQGKLTQLMFSRPYSRKLEAEADEVGLQLAAKACADVRAGPVFWQQMEMRDRLQGEPELPEWLSTHPSHKNRYTQLDRLIPQALELRASCECPILPGTDPRVVFSKSVHLLLENAKKQTKVHPDVTPKRRSHSPVSTLLPLTPLTTSLTSDQENKGPTVDNTTASLVLTPAEMESAHRKSWCPS
ncbi:metalloendopeptidase OMA1, mitochondrial [Eucyclogobius newberryi]|uniref:metalloendopeptidase OMA1, mitochondrial n=1 Tax=Eucyclogobius newberryi TaxID=166745 RepID=UPI003B5C85DC